MPDSNIVILFIIKGSLKYCSRAGFFVCDCRLGTIDDHYLGAGALVPKLTSSSARRKITAGLPNVDEECEFTGGVQR